MEIDHVGFGVEDFEASKRFYSFALAPLGLNIISEGKDWTIIGKKKCDLWFGKDGEAIRGLHLAFSADTHEQVDQFYENAIKNGAKDNGKPSICTEYDENYYAAFVIDLNGHNLEAVCRK